MSLLAADIGNSHTFLGLLDGEEVAAHWRVATDERRTSDEWAVLRARAARRAARRRRRDRGVRDRAGGAARVARDARAPLRRRPRGRRRARRAHRHPGADGQPARGRRRPHRQLPRRRQPATAAPRSSSTSAPRRRSTWSTRKGQYVGGAISPGIEISLEALGRRGAQLRKVELARPRSVIAKNTVEALQSGMLFGVAAQVEGMVARMIAELGCSVDDVTVISTGHLAPLVRRRMRVLHRAFAVADAAGTAARLRAQFLTIVIVRDSLSCFWRLNEWCHTAIDAFPHVPSLHEEYTWHRRSTSFSSTTSTAARPPRP